MQITDEVEVQVTGYRKIDSTLKRIMLSFRGSL